jgi:hypothetical protein
MSGKSGFAFGAYIEKVTSQESFSNDSDKSILKRCPKVRNWIECEPYIEKSLLSSLKGKVSRKDGSLIFNCSNKKSISLIDNKTGGDASTYYMLSDYYKELGLYLINIHYWEAYSYYLISERNCEQIQIWSEPIFSPDKNWLICACECMEASYICPNGVQIWKKSGDSYYNVFEKNLKWRAVNPKWNGNNKIEIIRYDGPFREFYKFKAEMNYINKKWELIE